MHIYFQEHLLIINTKINPEVLLLHPCCHSFDLSSLHIYEEALLYSVRANFSLKSDLFFCSYVTHVFSCNLSVYI